MLLMNFLCLGLEPWGKGPPRDHSRACSAMRLHDGIYETIVQSLPLAHARSVAVMKTHQLWLGALLSTICACSGPSAEDTRMLQQQMPSLGRANAWLNTHPLSAAELRGKVVLVDFWTYTCINWRRTLPYVRAWSEKYRDQGLVVVGVHTPEFSFEKDLDNVRREAREQQVNYPIAVDTDYAISVTGVAGPDGGSEEKPVGTVWFGLADRNSVRTTKAFFPGDRYLIRWRSSQAALDLLRRHILRSNEIKTTKSTI